MKHGRKCTCTPKHDDRGPRSRRPSWTLDLPPYWTPAQACAVYELLDDLMTLIGRRYGDQIQQAMHSDRVTHIRRSTCEDGAGEPF